MQQIVIRTDIIQGGDQWHAARLGKITGSGFAKLVGTAAAKEKYIYDKASEIVTRSRCDGDEYTNIHMQRGNEYESIARVKYILDTLNDVQEVGIVEYDDYTACSPDGLVGDDGIIEIKVLDSNNHFKQILKISSKGIQAIPKDHLLQMQFNMFVCNRQWCDYVLYNQKHEVNNGDLFVYRVEKDIKTQLEIKAAIEEAKERIISCVNKYYLLVTKTKVNGLIN